MVGFPEAAPISPISLIGFQALYKPPFFNYVR
jgi:hypothetical protein